LLTVAYYYYVTSYSAGEKLENIGFEWEIPREEQQQQQLQQQEPNVITQARV